MRVIGRTIDQLGADQVSDLLRELFRDEDSPTERWVARIGKRQVGLDG